MKALIDWIKSWWLPPNHPCSKCGALMVQYGYGFMCACGEMKKDVEIGFERRWIKVNKKPFPKKDK